MVSIPDWSRFRGIRDSANKNQTPSANRYRKQREEEAIKQAEEHGYFTDATRKFIEDRFIRDDEEAKRQALIKGESYQKDLRVLYMMKLTQSHLRGVGDIGLCTNLRICVLSGNYITRFDALEQCVHLIKLDLHSNQITVLPGPEFWSAMRHLCVLSLHDNPIGRIENLHYLSACPRLLALTLYDTPLSLKRNYRHHVVNSIWTLKALDRHVISDEEIIEDAEFGKHFAAMHASFKLNLCRIGPDNASYTEELREIRRLLSDINAILAHHSPVLIVQRYARGYLLRKRFKHAQDLRIWGAVTIQRSFRDYKSMSSPKSVDGPPPPSPATTDTRTMGSLGGPKRPLVLPQTDPIKLDYDTYMKNRRPGSVTLSERDTGRSRDAQAPDLAHLPSTPVEVATPQGSTTPDLLSPERRKTTNIHINLAKLHAGGTLGGLHDYDEAGLADSLALSATAGGLTSGPRGASLEYGDGRTGGTGTRTDWTKVKKRKPPSEAPRRRVMKSVKQFFGPVVEQSETPEPAAGPEEEEEVPMIGFRLRGRQQAVTFYDPTTDMILARKEAGREIRAAEDEYHTQAINNAAKQRLPKVKPSATNDQRLFARMQGTMGMTCLQAIQQAYKDRERAEKRVAKMETVLSQKEQRDVAKERIRHYHDERRSRALRGREKDQQRVVDHLGKMELDRQNTMDHCTDTRRKSSQTHVRRKRERTFMTEFNVQNTSVSNALLRHDRQARSEDVQLDRTERIQSQREDEREQREVVNKYMQHRQLMRQTESAMSKAAVDTKMLQEANDRLMMARARVAQQKSANAHVQAFYPLPALTSQTLPEVEAETGSVSLKHFDKWNLNKMNRNTTMATM